MDAATILGTDGRIAQRLKTYEQRPEQFEMAEAVQDAIASQSHLIVEAGTGVGKSFAYLVPAILAAHQQEDSGDEESPRRRIVVSTHTISLQEQLIQRDIPFLNAVLPLEFSAVLVKGRSNYLSLRRLNVAAERSATLFAESEQVEQLKSIRGWARQTGDGSRSDLPFRPLPQVWDEVQSEHGNCLGRNCPTYNDCFYYRARRRVWNADLLVVNHALFFSDLALRREGASVLPDYDVVILDEAHTVEGVAGDHMGLSVSSGQIEYLLSKLYNERTQKGLLIHHRMKEEQQIVTQLRGHAREFFAELDDFLQQNGASNGRVLEPPIFPSDLVPTFKRLGISISQFADGIEKEEHRIELTAASDRCIALAESVDSWMNQKIADAVYWTEETGGKRRQMKLICCPIDVGPVLREELFNKVPSVILTSATLAVGKGNFEFFKTRLGLTQTKELKLGSPFDYKSQVRLIFPEGLPDPAASDSSFESAVCDKIRKYVAQTEGRAFVLFTSYRMLKNCVSRLTRWLAENNIALFAQGEELPRSMMLDQFRKRQPAVLFGTDSFWQGVDIPGDALQNVIITRLPFSVPDHPLLAARMERIREQGGNPFMDYQIPEAIIKLKQGFGRLIRSTTDTGQVVILDPRIRTKRYGKLFLDSLPECDVVIDE